MITDNKIKTFGKCAVLYGIGSVGYSLIEIMWRGFTHWTMSVCGGVCLVCLYFADMRMVGKKLWQICLAGSALITAVEFLTGIIVNRMLNWNVWDYSKMKLNLFGQVCLLYSAIWFILCIPAVFICRTVRKNDFR